MIQEFINLVRSHIGRAIYVWGGQGQVVSSEAQIRRMETSEANALRAITLWKKFKALGIDPVWMDDCSGLVVWPLQLLGVLNVDYTANSFYRLSETCPAAEARVGDFAFCLNDDGFAVHIGVVTKRVSSSEVLITEAKGRDYGVVERSSKLGSWDAYGHNSFIDTSKEENMLLEKGVKGQGVYCYQILCRRLKMPIGEFDDMVLKDPSGAFLKTGCDGSFGGTMVTVTNTLNRLYGLPETALGTVTDALMARLQLNVMSIPSKAEYPELLTKYNSAVALSESLKSQAESMTLELSKLRAERENLSGQVGTLKGEILNLNKTITELKLRVSERTQQIGKLNDRIIDLEKRAGEIIIERDQAKARAEDFLKDLTTLGTILGKYH